MKRHSMLLVVLLPALMVNTAAAHYLWLSENSGNEGRTANVYFEEGPRPGDGGYLDPIAKSGKLWVRTAAAPKPEEVKLTEVTSPGKRWLSAGLTAERPYAMESSAKYGVYKYGQTDVLLYYNARYVDVASADELKAVSRAEQLRLDLAPTLDGDKLTVQAFFEGKPVGGRQLFIRGPEGFKQTLKLDEQGRATIEWKTPGQYFMRTYVDEADKAGVDGGKEYQLTRTHVSLTVDLPIDGGK